MVIPLAATHLAAVSTQSLSKMNPVQNIFPFLMPTIEGILGSSSCFFSFCELFIIKKMSKIIKKTIISITMETESHVVGDATIQVGV